MTDDLGGDSSQNASPPILMTAQASLLEQQTLWQRRWSFWIVLAVSVMLYAAFIFVIFFSERFRCLVAMTPFAVSIAIALLILPSLLIWSLVRAVYRSQEKTEPDAFALADKIISFAEKSHKFIR